jgi:hypothetical protein
MHVYFQKLANKAHSRNMEGKEEVQTDLRGLLCVVVVLVIDD